MSRPPPPVSALDHVRGHRDAPVVLIEYGDFECPYCAQAYYVVRSLEETFGSTLAVVFRHFPLASAHPHAEIAALAAEAAGAQGRFWPMHDVMFEHQDRLDPQDLLRDAALLGLDERRFADDLSQRRHAQKVRDDFMGGVHAGVSGTPTFYVNGMKQRSFDPALLRYAIEQAADAATGRSAQRRAAR